MVTTFEASVAKVAGTMDAAVVSSGTSALHCAYAALNAKAGDEVITTPLTFVATAATAMAQGANIRFADVQEDTGNIDPLGWPGSPTALAPCCSKMPRIQSAPAIAGEWSGASPTSPPFRFSPRRISPAGRAVPSSHRELTWSRGPCAFAHTAWFVIVRSSGTQTRVHGTKRCIRLV